MADAGIKKLLIFTLAFQLIMSFAGGIYQNNVDLAQQELLEQTAYYQDLHGDLGGNFGNTTPDTATISYEKSFGDTRYGGRQIWNMLKGGFGFSEVPDNADPLTVLLTQMLNWTIHALNALLVISGVIFFFTRDKN